MAIARWIPLRIASKPGVAVLSRRPGIGLFACLAFLMASGCSEEIGPERPPTTRVEGTITIGGRPVTSGWVEFLPTEGTEGNLRTARISKDGTFSAGFVPVGRVAVAFADLRIPPIPTALGPVEAWSFRFNTTPIRKSIPAGPKASLDLDLAAEAYAFRKQRQELVRSFNE
jgi:hypothetical protein